MVCQLPESRESHFIQILRRSLIRLPFDTGRITQPLQCLQIKQPYSLPIVPLRKSLVNPFRKVDSVNRIFFHRIRQCSLTGAHEQFGTFLIDKPTNQKQDNDRDTNQNKFRILISKTAAEYFTQKFPKLFIDPFEEINLRSNQLTVIVIRRIRLPSDKLRRITDQRVSRGSQIHFSCVWC